MTAAVEREGLHHPLREYYLGQVLATSGAARIGLGTTIKYLRVATGINMNATTKYLRRTTSAAAVNGLETTIKYLVNQKAGAGNNWAKAHYT
jgi:hypothetical protein